MKILPLLTFAVTIGLSTGSLLSEKANAQVFNSSCAQGAGSCAYNDYPKNNPNFYLRTSPQAAQQPVNRVDQVCSDNNSSTCNRLAPKIETRQNDTFQDLRQRQINTIEERQ